VSSPPPSPEDGNRSSFRNIVFSRIPDDGKSPKIQQFCGKIINLKLIEGRKKKYITHSLLELSPS
jgi:hypothetical protein